MFFFYAKFQHFMKKSLKPKKALNRLEFNEYNPPDPK